MPQTPLSERGLQQAAALGERLAREGVDRILASDYARASMTAEAVQQATGATLELHPDLRERNYGELRGRPYSEVGEYILMEGYEPPGGESWEVFHARVDGAWQLVRDALQRTRGNLAVVTHGLVCYSFARRNLSVPKRIVLSPSCFANTSLTIAEAHPPFRVELLGCAAHLDADPIEGDGSHAPRAQGSVC